MDTAKAADVTRDDWVAQPWEILAAPLETGPGWP
jgi:hypothetical protein